ncbi:MAG: hypothetical protein FJ303_04020 [Planctomycetes bacterium]|nr:hypothetical protein [Planctomycetota bacterium]
MNSMHIVAFAIVLAGAAPVIADTPPHSLADLKRLGESELTRLFEGASLGEIPVGPARGHVLLMSEARLPRVKARLANSVWKGKHFDADGGFINQWPGFQALRGSGAVGTSWHDAKPCLVLDYPSGTPVFGNTRDELRQVAPGLYLGRLYERCPCPRFRGYFAIEMCCLSK